MPTTPSLLSVSQLNTALNLRDLTDPRIAPHAMQLLVNEIHSALALHWQCRRQIIRNNPVVSLNNNYDRLGYPKDGAARDARYTRYITEQLILRTQTSAAIPDILAGLSIDPPEDLLLILPGLVYRRDSIDKLHCSEPQQLDLWRITEDRRAEKMSALELHEMINTVMTAALPGMEWRCIGSPHPYTEQGLQIDVHWHDQWVEVGECGLVAKAILSNAGLQQHSGLAMGLGLDRLLMLRKNIPDIRLLRNQEPRISTQMNDLSPYQAVSMMPAIRRDLSLAVDRECNEESIGDLIRNHLREWPCIEALTIKSTTPYTELPPSARQRMGMAPRHKNILLRLTIRHMDRTLTDPEANAIRNEIYTLLHEGEQSELALNS